MASSAVICAFCGEEFQKRNGLINRSNRIGAPHYCTQKCSAGPKRVERDEEDWKRQKAEYDRKRREELADVIRQKRAEYYQRTSDREKERRIRAARMPLHVEYCRRPEYKAKKHEYDLKRSEEQYGEFAEAFRLLLELEREIIARVPDKYERLKARGYYDPARVQERKRKWQSQKQA